MTDTDAGKRLSDAFIQVRRKQFAEVRPYSPGEDISGISVSQEDRSYGSPLAGDWIARNPKNHKDQWLVAAQYFADNFEPITTERGSISEERAREILGACAEKYHSAETLRMLKSSEVDVWLSAKIAIAAIQQAVSESSAPQNGEMGELVKVLTERWKEYRVASVDSARSFPERMAAGGHAGGLKEAIDALTRLSQPSTPSGEAVRGIEERDEALRWVKAMERQGEDYIWRGAKKTREFIEALSQSPPHACCEGMREKAAALCDEEAGSFYGASSHKEMQMQQFRIEAVQELAAAIRALPLPVSADGRDAWQLIETWTEKDGRHVLGRSTRFGGVVAEFLHHDDGWTLATFNGQVIRETPTHWQPLPKPPLNPQQPSDTPEAFGVQPRSHRMSEGEK